MEKNAISKITAIIPCYNDGAYILEALNSLLNQTLVPDKVIIVDDGSNQFTKEVLSTINHPIVEIIYQQNRGVSAARNAGIERVTTEYILTLDADDYFEPTFVEKALQILEQKTEIGAVCCYYRKFIDSTDMQEIIQPIGKSVEYFLCKNNGVASALYRKKAWDDALGYDSSFVKGYEDWDFWISVLAHGWKMEVIPEVLFNYRVKENSRDKKALLYDTELKLQLLEKHDSVYRDNYHQAIKDFIKTEGKLKNKIIKTEQSVDFKLGNAILIPFRAIKRWITKS